MEDEIVMPFAVRPLSRKSQKLERQDHEVKRCFCGKLPKVKTSWTYRHPGRRFQVCPTYGVGSCGFWEWYDPENCHRCKAIIPGLLRKNGILEEELKKSRVRSRKLWVALIVSWIVMYVMKV